MWKTHHLHIIFLGKPWIFVYDWWVVTPQNSQGSLHAPGPARQWQCFNRGNLMPPMAAMAILGLGRAWLANLTAILYANSYGVSMCFIFNELDI
jgi:hypothetical protein